MRNRVRGGLSALLPSLLLFTACAADAPTVPVTIRGGKPVTDVGRVVFIGNSLTFTNSLVVIVDSLAAASGIRIESLEIARGNTGLIDHWNDPVTRFRVANGGFDHVVMQQGPSSLPESRDSLRAWAKLWEPEIRAAGAKPALYAVWPDRSRLFAFPDVSESYRLAAADIGGLFFPVGDTWLETWERDPAAPLYGPDDFHPSLAGTYAAAVVIVSVLANRRPTTLTPDFRVPPFIAGTIDSTLADTIRRAAEDVLDRRDLRRDGQPDHSPIFTIRTTPARRPASPFLAK